MTIRPATIDDLAGIFAIYDHEVLHGTATFDTVPKTPDERLEWFQANPGGRYPILVADDGGTVAGWARLYQWSPRPAYARTAENAVYVHREARGRGLGRALLGALLAAGAGAGVRNVIARITDGNPASLALHRALGFEMIGTMRGAGEKFGRVIDVHLMQRALGAPTLGV